MPYLYLALGHMRRHWRLNLVILAGLTLAGAFMAGLPAFATSIAARHLRHTLQDAPVAARNLRVEAPSGLLNAALYGSVTESLGELVQNRIAVTEKKVLADPPAHDTANDSDKIPPTDLHLWAFDKLAQNVRVLEGKLPDQPEPRSSKPSALPPPLEVAIGAQASTRTGWRVGDRLTFNSGMNRLDIVGVLEPLNPDDEIWWGHLVPFAATFRPKNPNEDIIKLSLFVHPQALKTFVSTPQTYWRIALDQNRLTIDNVLGVQSALLNLEAQLKANRADLSTGLMQMFADYQAELSQVRIALFLLTAQAFIFVLYTLAMLSSFLLERSRGELAALAGRGATGFQITLIFALSSLILALLAAGLLGPALALGGLKVWSLVANAAVPATLSLESWVLALVACTFGWLAVLLPVYSASRRNLLDWQRHLARPAQRARWQKMHLDVFMLLLGSLIVYQLSRSGSVVMRRLGDETLLDPLLLLGPTFLLIAVALLFLRFFPPLLRLSAWIVKQAQGLMLPLSTARLARNPVGPSRVVLLICLAAGLVLFASGFVRSLDHGQNEIAHYLAGADLRVALALPDRANLPIGQLSTLPGIDVVSPVFRSILNKGVGGGGAINLLAIDPATFDKVARYPRSVSSLSTATLARVLQSEPTSDTLPAIFSDAALPRREDKAIGQRLTFSLVGATTHRFTFEVVGIISNFPTLSGRFILVSLPALEERLGSDFLRAPISGSSYEAWLTTDPSQRALLATVPELEDRILGDTEAGLRRLQAELLAQGVSNAFRLNALTLGVLSVAAFFMTQYFSARQRSYESGVLRAVGLSARQLLALFITESVLVMGFGLLAGTIIGYSLTQLMLPYLSRALGTALAGTSIVDILIDWPGVIRLYAFLIASYATAMLLLAFSLARIGVQRTLRMSEE